jgi:co-chaperonin GroES (HSP10)
VVKLVEDEVKTKSGVIIPSKRNESFNRLGRVLAVGSGWFQGRHNSIYSKVGDICFFQLEQHQAINTAYMDKEHGLVFFLHDLDMIARLTEPSFDLEYFQVIGPWILVKVETRGLYPDSRIIVPQVENTTAELQTYTVIQKGGGVKIDLNVGDEVSLARTRCNPIYLDRQLYGWIEEKFVYGAMTTGERKAPSQS